MPTEGLKVGQACDLNLSIVPRCLDSSSSLACAQNLIWSWCCCAQTLSQQVDTLLLLPACNVSENNIALNTTCLSIWILECPQWKQKWEVKQESFALIALHVWLQLSSMWQRNRLWRPTASTKWPRTQSNKEHYSLAQCQSWNKCASHHPFWATSEECVVFWICCDWPFSRQLSWVQHDKTQVAQVLSPAMVQLFHWRWRYDPFCLPSLALPCGAMTSVQLRKQWEESLVVDLASCAVLESLCELSRPVLGLNLDGCTLAPYFSKPHVCFFTTRIQTKMSVAMTLHASISDQIISVAPGSTTSTVSQSIKHYNYLLFCPSRQARYDHQQYLLYEVEEDSFL